MISGIPFVTIPVADQDRAIAFYRDKLGFTLREDNPMGTGQRWVTMDVPGSTTAVTLYTPDGQSNRIGTFNPVAFKAGDVQATFEQLKAKGVEFTQEPTHEPWGSFCIFNDSEGNSFIIGSEAEG